MPQSYKLEMKYPSQCWQALWREAIPLGNGTTGASVYGSVWDETIMITHTDLWWRSHIQELPDVSYILPEIRKMLLQNRPMEADRLMKQELESKGYRPQLALPLPLCDLKLKMATAHGFRNYRRSLDMATGEAEVTWDDGDRTYRRTCFVTYDKDVFVMEIAEKHHRPFRCEFYLHSHDTDDAQKFGATAEDLLPAERQSYATPDGHLFYSAQNDDGTFFGAVASIVADGETEIKEDHLVVLAATKVTIILKTFIKASSREQRHETRNQVDACGVSYQALFAPHAAAWQSRFLATSLHLRPQAQQHCNEELLLDAYQGEASEEMLEKLWNYGRYLLLASSREGGNPCHLYGLWCGEYQGTWAFNMVNVNLQMIYWQALSSNMPELLLPVFDYVERLMDDFRLNAARLYGCRGIFIPAPTTPETGVIQVILPHILYWTGGAGWVGQHYYHYYLCTRDKAFLKNRAIPYLKEVALFYEDFFVEGEDGFYMTIPSNSPENSPGNYWDGEAGMGAIMETTMNATMDFAIAKETLTHLIEACEICGVEADNIPKWEQMRAKIPPYQTNDDGAIKEWMHEFFKDNYKHRHLSHIYPLFPGDEVHRETDPELYAAFVLAAKKRLQIGLNQQTGWSLAYLSNIFARMQDGDQALECLDLISRACVLRNFMTVHNDWRQMGIGVRMPWAPVQLDANMGMTAALNEMLMQSYGDTILVLPALPARLRQGHVKGLLTRQGILVDICWDMDRMCFDVTLDNHHAPREIILRAPAGYQPDQAVHTIEGCMTIHFHKVP